MPREALRGQGKARVAAGRIKEMKTVETQVKYAYSTSRELEILEEERKNFSDGIHQALDALSTLKRLAGKSTIASDFQVTAHILRDALLRTNSHISELKKVIEDAIYEVNCAICGTIAETKSYEEAITRSEEHLKKHNNLHVCVVIEK